MSESGKMILVLAVICGACGFLLAGVKRVTEDRIEEQIMRYVKGPAVQEVLGGATNNPLEDRRQVTVGGAPVTVFIGKTDGAISSLAYETTAEGFGGELGVMVGYGVTKDDLVGVGITSHKETPGVGARVTQDEFTGRFVGKPLGTNFAVTKDGGAIDALTGATISSRAVCAAVRESVKEFPEIKAQVLKQ